MNSYPAMNPKELNRPAAGALSRRRFLAQAGIGLVSVSTLSRAVAQDSAANPRLRIGLIGCGARGRWLLNLFSAHGGYQVVGAADYFGERAQEVATKFALSPAQTFTGLKCAEKMIARGGLDAVAVISPPYFHPAQARAAVDAGLHVYLAKPVAVDVPGCRSIQASGELARKQGLVFIVDFQTRMNGFYIEAMKRIHSGAIGEMCFGESTYHAGRLAINAPPGTAEARLKNWVFDQTLSGDIIVEQNIHTLDVMSWIMKDTPPVSCSGTGGRRVRIDVGDAWDHYALVYEYANQVGVTFSSRQFDAHGAPDGIINHMFGTKGTFFGKYGGDVMIRGGKDTFYRGGATTGIYRDGAVGNIRAFHDAVLKKDASNATVEPSVMSNLVSIMGRTATREKRTVTWTELMKTNRPLEADLSGLHA